MVPSLMRSRVASDVSIGDEQAGAISLGAFEGFANILTRGGFETDHGVDLVGAGLGEERLSVIHCRAGVALDVDYLSDLDSGEGGEGILVSLEALVEVGLTDIGEEDDVALAVELGGDALAAKATGLKIVGADEEEAVALGRVGVQGDDRDTGGDGLIDFGGEHGTVADGDEDASGLGGYDILELGDFSLGIEGVRTAHVDGDAVLGGRSLQAREGSLPVGNLDIGGDEVVTITLAVAGASGEQRQNGGGEEYRLLPGLRHTGWISYLSHDQSPLKLSLRVEPRRDARLLLFGDSRYYSKS